MGCCDGNKIEIVRNVQAGATVAYLARIKKSTGVDVTGSDVASYRVDVWEVTDDDKIPTSYEGAEIEDGSAYDGGDVEVYDSLVTDEYGRWCKDSEGYNLEYPTELPEADKEYLMTIKLELTNGDVLKPTWRIFTV